MSRRVLLSDSFKNLTFSISKIDLAVDVCVGDGEGREGERGRGRGGERAV